LQVATTPIAGATTLLRSVQFTRVHEVVDVRPQRRELDDKIAALRAPTQAVQDEITLADRALANYEALRTKLTSQQATAGGKGSPFVYDAALWAKFSKFISDGTAAETAKRRDATRRLALLAKDKSELEAAKSRLGGGDERRSTREVAEVTLTVQTATAGATVELDLLLSYMLTGCSWAPSYDLRIDKVAKTMGVTYNAVVRQRAGEDWRDVRLELSTAKAFVGGEIPNFTTPWYLKKRQPVVQSYADFGGGGGGRGGQQQQMMMQQMVVTNMMNVMPTAPPAAAAPPPPPRGFASVGVTDAQVSSSSTSATFTIAALSTVLADNEPVKVTVAMFELPIFFRYSVVPKLDPNVYLKVKATNTTDFPLLAGPSNIFADEQLVSRSQMDDVAPREEFWTFLGVDGSITCARKEVSRKTTDVSGGMFGTNKHRVDFVYRFTAKNVKTTQEELVVWDQMPIAEDSRITVVMTTPNPEEEGKPVRGTGPKDTPFFKINDVKFIEWFLQLRPSEERTFEFAFSVAYPQENTVVGL
jgi:uncharacterized protein (TIGR02231 family)